MQLFPARGACPAFLLLFQPIFQAGVSQLDKILQAQSSVWPCFTKVNEHLAGEDFTLKAILNFLAFYAFSKLTFGTPFVDKT
jgi:hypothetical protein